MPTCTSEIAAALFGPGRLETNVAGTPLTIQEDTAYPFEQAVRFTLQPARPVSFTFTVRIPAWCHQASITINGRPLAETLTPGSYHSIARGWDPGDQLVVSLPFELDMKRWPEGGISLEYGPLTLSLPIASPMEHETTDDWERIPKEFRLAGPQVLMPDFPGYRLLPDSGWAYALALDEESMAHLAKVSWNEPGGYPLEVDKPALRVSVPARKVKDWTVTEADLVIRSLPTFENGKFAMIEKPVVGHFTLTPPLPDPQSLPGRLSDEVVWIDLVPYGNTLLRLTVFPDGMKK